MFPPDFAIRVWHFECLFTGVEIPWMWGCLEEGGYEDHLAKSEEDSEEATVHRKYRKLGGTWPGPAVLSELVGSGHPWNEIRTFGDLAEVRARSLAQRTCSSGVERDEGSPMGFVRQATAAVLLISATLWFQCGGMAILIHLARTSIERGIGRLTPWHAAVLMIRFTVVMISLHILQVLVWAAFYRWRCLSSWEAGFYFSAASYSTVGYGDIVLPRVWRILGPVESITGMLMCGLSVSGLFAILLRLVASEERSSEALP